MNEKLCDFIKKYVLINISSSSSTLKSTFSFEIVIYFYDSLIVYY